MLSRKEGFNSPATTTSVSDPGHVAWSPATLTAKATLDENEITEALRATGFDFGDMGDDDSILGIEVKITMQDEGDTDLINDFEVHLVLNGSGIGDEYGSNVWPGTPTEFTYGASDDDWTAALSGSDVKDSSFGVEIRANHIGGDPTSTTINVSSITMCVTYEPAETGHGDESTPRCGDCCEDPCGCEKGRGVATSTKPIKYFNGEVMIESADVMAGGFGQPWGHERVYSNQLSRQYDHRQGFNWLMRQWPYLVDKGGTAVVFVQSSHEAVWFDEDSGDYTARHGAHHTLSHDEMNEVFTLVMPEGKKLEFHDFMQMTYPPGAFKSETSPGGVKTEVISYNSDGGIEEVQRSYSSGGSTTTESFKYDFLSSGDNQGRLEFVTLRRKVDAGSWTNIRRAKYEYYDVDEDHGGQGDLKRVTIQTHDGAAWNDLEVFYYRYYKSGDTNGDRHLLKYVVNPEGYKRLDDAVSDPLTATDAQVADYADHYFEYDSSNRVTKETVDGGSKSYTFAYTTSSHSNDYNNWKHKTVETLPDNNQRTVYCNYLGQVLIDEFKAGTDEWIEYHEYDSDGREIKRATPAAVSSYDDSYADLNVSLNANDGLIHVTDYYTTGAGEGHVQHEKIKQGDSGTEIKLRSFEYTSQTEDGVTVVHPSKETVYRNDDGTGAIDTTYAYTFHSSTVQIEKRTTTLPAVPTGQNGSGSSNTREEVFDKYGNLEWEKDERGAITRYKYDVVTGAMTQMIQDVDTTQVSDEPSGWSTPSGFGLNLVTDYEHDDVGRQTQELGPEHSIDINGTATTIRRAGWTVYQDEDHEVWSAQGYAHGTGFNTYTLVNPVSISKLDRTGRVVEEIQATRASTSGKLSATDTFAQSDYVRWTTHSYTDEGDLEWSRVYHKIPSSGVGSSATNYDQTDFDYDSIGRQNMAKTPGGTITRTVFDDHGNGQKVYVGTDDTSATESDPTGGGAQGNNMKLVTEHEYDSGNDGGNGNLTKETQHVDSSTTRVTTFGYDWRDRQDSIDGEEDFYQESTYDNLDQVTKVDQKDTTSTGNLVARSETKFDDLGRVYQSKRYAVDVSTGTVGNALTDDNWYDEAGNILKQKPAGSEAFTKFEYDGLGRQTKQFVAYDTDETAYADADDVVGDTIFEQTETDYDDASNAIESRLRRRHHDATGTGELTTPGGSQPKARVSYVAAWHDALGREIAEANYGTNSDTALSRPSTVPTRSDTVLVTETFYNDDGEAFKTIDPAGRDDRQEFDDAGRETKTIENYDDGDPTTGAADKDRTVEYAYNADGLVKTITAKQQSASDDQVTKYVYGTTLSDSDIARSDLLRAGIYPDSDDVDDPLGDGADQTYDRIEYKYNSQGERKEMKDQNESVHVYEFDKLGRETHDRVTTLGSGVDGAVRRISTTYEVRGLIEKMTSYDNATVGSGNVVNEVVREYNDLGLIDKEYQEHEGAKDGNTLYVGYNYDETASGGEFTKGLRLKSARYPNGRLVHYTYGSSGSDADNLKRLDAIKDDNAGSPGGPLASYTYLGLGMIVIEDYEEPDVKLDYFGGTSGSYAGFDRFDRVVDQRWYDHGASEDRDRYKYGYDRVSNRTYRENTVSKAQTSPVYLDEFYTYDGLNRLKNFDRGELNAGKTAITGTPSKEEDWTLDPLGNWEGLIQKSDGTTDLDQSQTVNQANEITDIDETTGPSWATPAYDRNGNITTAPKPADLTSSLTGKYDAWNRLVEAKDGSTVIGVYEYDGVQRRVKTHVDSQAPDDPNGIDNYEHAYYDTALRVIETRETSVAAAAPETLQPFYQYVLSPRAVGAAILRDTNTDEDNTCDDERLYVLSDANTNTSSLADTSGTAVECYAYDAYGSPTVYDGSWTGLGQSSVYNNNILFAGRHVDVESGLCFCHRRYHHYSLGRFIQRDPLEYGGGIENLYCYALASPTDLVDPFGTEPKRPPIRIFKPGTHVPYDDIFSGTEANGYFGIGELTGIIDVQMGAKIGRTVENAPRVMAIGFKTGIKVDCSQCCWVQFGWHEFILDRVPGRKPVRIRRPDAGRTPRHPRGFNVTLTTNPARPNYFVDARSNTNPCYDARNTEGRAGAHTRSPREITIYDGPSPHFYAVGSWTAGRSGVIRSILHFDAFLVCNNCPVFKVAWKVEHVWVRSAGKPRGPSFAVEGGGVSYAGRNMPNPAQMQQFALTYDPKLMSC